MDKGIHVYSVFMLEKGIPRFQFSMHDPSTHLTCKTMFQPSHPLLPYHPNNYFITLSKRGKTIYISALSQNISCEFVKIFLSISLSSTQSLTTQVMLCISPTFLNTILFYFTTLTLISFKSKPNPTLILK